MFPAWGRADRFGIVLHEPSGVTRPVRGVPHYRCRCTFADGFCAPFPDDRVRLTSIYSKGDGVVRWQAQFVRYAECVEVTGSHVGLVFNRKSYRAIAQALAAPALAPGLPERPFASVV